MRARFAHLGFTLIELMVVLAVLAILATVAIPSFMDFRERAALRGAGDQFVAFWANAKLEALKRNSNLTVTIQQSGDSFCLGATTGGATCNCLTSTTSCAVSQFPSNQSEWRGVTMVGAPTLGSVGAATIDPKRGYLTAAGDDGGATVQSPGNNRFRLRFYVDRWGRPYLCAPTDSPQTLSDYSTRTCAP